MGALTELGTGERLPLVDLHRVGRDPSCALVLGGRFASREHAIVAWTGEGWELRDLGGQNGTAVDGVRVPAGTRAPLRRGARLAFGTDEPTHLLADDGPPEPLARTADGRWLEGRDGMLDLPGPEGERIVLRDPGGGWRLESDGAVRPVRDGERIDDGERALRLCLPNDDARTLPRVAGAAPRATFRVSLDEEQVALEILEAGRPLDLGARSHHYLLLTLARARQADRARGLPESEAGWVDAERLARQLRQEPKYLNVLIHRARRQASEAGLACASFLVERREQARQVRFGLPDLEVVR